MRTLEKLIEQLADDVRLDVGGGEVIDRWEVKALILNALKAVQEELNEENK